MKWIVKFLAVSGALFLTPSLISGIEVSSWWPTAFIAAFLLALLNITVRPVLALLTLPINLLTLGLFTFVLNALIFWILNFIDGISIDGFVPALLGSLVITIVKWIVDLFFDKSN